MNQLRFGSAGRHVFKGCAILVSSALWAWSSAPAVGTQAPALASAATPANVEPAYQTYKYMGDRYRDPFIPLNGTNMDATDHAPAISALVLKGIVQDSKGRVAVLSSGVSSYLLRAGRLYDGRNHAVKGISGVIKAQSVVLVGSDRTVRELQLDKTAL